MSSLVVYNIFSSLANTILLNTCFFAGALFSLIYIFFLFSTIYHWSIYRFIPAAATYAKLGATNILG